MAKPAPTGAIKHKCAHSIGFCFIPDEKVQTKNEPLEWSDDMLQQKSAKWTQKKTTQKGIKKKTTRFIIRMGN